MNILKKEIIIRKLFKFLYLKIKTLKIPLKIRNNTNTLDVINAELSTRASIAQLACGLSSESMVAFDPKMKGGLAMKIIPRKTSTKLSKSTLKMGSFKSILAQKTVKVVAMPFLYDYGLFTSQIIISLITRLEFHFLCNTYT